MPPRQDALNQSFLLTDAEAQGSAERLGVAPGELSCLDTAAVVSTYCELLRMGNADVLHAVMNATEGLLCKLQVSQQTQPNFIAAGPAVRQLAILMHNPLFSHASEAAHLGTQEEVPVLR